LLTGRAGWPVIFNPVGTRKGFTLRVTPLAAHGAFPYIDIARKLLVTNKKVNTAISLLTQKSYLATLDMQIFS
jgi:hypothetical protein